MTKLQTRCLFFILLVPLFGNGCGQPSTEDKVKAIGGVLPRHHMSFGPTSPTTALFYGPTITDEKLAGIDLESLPTVINVTLMGTAITSDGLATVGRWTQVKQLNLDDNPRPRRSRNGVSEAAQISDDAHAEQDLDRRRGPPPLEWTGKSGTTLFVWDARW